MSSKKVYFIYSPLFEPEETFLKGLKYKYFSIRDFKSVKQLSEEYERIENKEKNDVAVNDFIYNNNKLIVDEFFSYIEKSDDFDIYVIQFVFMVDDFNQQFISLKEKGYELYFIIPYDFSNKNINKKGSSIIEEYLLALQKHEGIASSKESYSFYSIMYSSIIGMSMLTLPNKYGLYNNFAKVLFTEIDR